jgi:hypothetical protein
MSNLSFVGAVALVATATVVLCDRHSASASDPDHTLGIGNIVATFDRTTESFAVYRALRGQLAVDGRPFDVQLVDQPRDAPFSISGHMDGSIALHEEKDAFWMNVWYHWYTYELVFKLRVWDHGKKVGEIEVPCNGETAHEQLSAPNLRERIVASCAASLTSKVAESIASRLHAGGQ